MISGCLQASTNRRECSTGKGACFMTSTGPANRGQVSGGGTRRA